MIKKFIDLTSLKDDVIIEDLTDVMDIYDGDDAGYVGRSYKYQFDNDYIHYF